MAAAISGRTRLAGIVGHPLDHTLSPAMHNAAYEAMGVDWVYVPLEVASEGDIFRFVGALKALPFVGVNVTMPYKQAALQLCDEVATFAQMAGAVNTIHVSDGRLIGYNTDGRGLLESLESEAGFVPGGRRVVVYGAGGAAGAAAVAFVLGKAESVVVVNRTREKAEALVGRVAMCAGTTEVLGVCSDEECAEKAVRAADLVVNATSVGMSPEDPPLFPVEWLRPDALLCDMVYRSGPTSLVERARAAGVTALDGLGMLVAQGATAIDIWGEGDTVRAPRDVMRAAAEAVLRERAGEGS